MFEFNGIALPYIKDNDEARVAFLKWYASRPPRVKKMIELRPFGTCYVSINASGERGHYAICSYRENGTIIIQHGADSFLPGVGVFGVLPEDLTLCGCGKWERPTDEQLKVVDQVITAVKASRDN
jgi:hypothetical protein